MSIRFVNRPSVKTDIVDATNYYKKINPELAIQLCQELEKQKIIFLAYLLVFK